MSLFIESIKLINGKFQNLFYHEQRMMRSLGKVCGVHDEINLEEFFSNVDVPGEGLFKCRLEYDDESRQVEFVPYVSKRVASLKVVENDRIGYDFKYKDRSKIDRLFEKRGECDDILIVKKGHVTDASYANVVFFRNDRWITPWSALLKGTMRQHLLDTNLIEEEEIQLKDISSFESCKLINAMLGFDAPEIPISNIVM